MITLAGQIAFIRSMADGSWRLIIDMPESTPIDELKKANRKAVFLGISLAELTNEEKQILSEAGEIERGKHFFDD